jgi:hypothetical protein
MKDATDDDVSVDSLGDWTDRVIAEYHVLQPAPPPYPPTPAQQRTQNPNESFNAGDSVDPVDAAQLNAIDAHRADSVDPGGDSQPNASDAYQVRRDLDSLPFFVSSSGGETVHWFHVLRCIPDQ